LEALLVLLSKPLFNFLIIDYYYENKNIIDTGVCSHQSAVSSKALEPFFPLVDIKIKEAAGRSNQYIYGVLE